MNFLKEFNISDWLRIDILPTTALRQFGYNVTERRVISGIQQLSVILNGQLYSNYFISNYVWHIVAGHFIGLFLLDGNTISSNNMLWPLPSSSIPRQMYSNLIQSTSPKYSSHVQVHVGHDSLPLDLPRTTKRYHPRPPMLLCYRASINHVAYLHHAPL